MSFIKFCLIIVIGLSGCSNNIEELLTGPNPDISKSTRSNCHQQARANVRQNWQKIGRDWIKHEEYRQYTHCVDKTKNENG